MPAGLRHHGGQRTRWIEETGVGRNSQIVKRECRPVNTKTVVYGILFAAELGFCRSLALQAPRGAHGALAQGVCLGIAEEGFFLRVPAQGSSQREGDPRELADRVGADRHIDIGDGFGSRSYTVEEILLVMGTHGEVDFVGADLFLQE